MDAPDWSPVIVASKPSIFFVLLRPKGEEERDEITDMADEVESKEEEERAAACNAIEHYATGFAVGTVGEAERQRILVLTCAHTIEHTYHGAWQPIDVATINRLYDIELYCPHSELDWIEQGGGGPRSSFAALACSIDCSKDMLLLTACVREIALRTELIGRGRLTERHPVLCPLPHPELHISTVLEMGRPCLLLSWPGNFIHLLYQGHQCELREVEIISANAAGYDMSVLEAQIGSKEGSSGAPLFNLAGEVIGILHGGFGEHHSYFVSPQHMQEFLTTARDEAAAAAAAEVATSAAIVEKLDAANLAWCASRRHRS